MGSGDRNWTGFKPNRHAQTMEPPHACSENKHRPIMRGKAFHHQVAEYSSEQSRTASCLPLGNLHALSIGQCHPNGMHSGEAGCNTLLQGLKQVSLQGVAQRVKSAITGCAKARCMSAIACSDESIMLGVARHSTLPEISLRKAACMRRDVANCKASAETSSSFRVAGCVAVACKLTGSCSFSLMSSRDPRRPVSLAQPSVMIHSVEVP
jgi:hypothetical protein